MTTTGAPRLILIVDDSPTQAKFLEHLLLANGYLVQTARNGLDALPLIEEHRPDLVISDIMMPEMDGLELCRRVRREGSAPGTPIILLTHLNDPADVLNSLEAGADYFVSKPYSNTLLLNRIATVFSGHGGRSGWESVEPVEIRYRDRSYRIGAGRAQIVELLLATYELAADKNQELLATQHSLSRLNRELEQRVAERTAALTRETAERLQAMEELRKKDEVLIQQSRQAAMGEMLGNIAHQWRQPLNAVGLLVQDLTLSHEYGTFTPDHLYASTTKIMQLVRHMSQTIDDFRNFFAPDRQKSEFDLAPVVERTLALVNGSLNDKGIVVEVRSGDAPRVAGYPNEFSQVLLNIFSNSMDAFSTSGCREPRIEVRLFGEGGKAVLTIADNAGGIPEEVIARIFEPYFTTKEQGKGTGIGLFMAKNIVEKSMNGSITARNVAGGAEFRIEV